MNCLKINNQTDGSTTEPKLYSYPCSIYRKSKRITNFLMLLILPKLFSRPDPMGDQVYCMRELGKITAFC